MDEGSDAVVHALQWLKFSHAETLIIEKADGSIAFHKEEAQTLMQKYGPIMSRKDVQDYTQLSLSAVRRLDREGRIYRHPL